MINIIDALISLNDFRDVDNLHAHKKRGYLKVGSEIKPCEMLLITNDNTYGHVYYCEECFDENRNKLVHPKSGKDIISAFKIPQQKESNCKDCIYLGKCERCEIRTSNTFKIFENSKGIRVKFFGLCDVCSPNDLSLTEN